LLLLVTQKTVTDKALGVTSSTIPGMSIIVNSAKFVHVIFQHYSQRKVKAGLMPKAEFLEVNASGSNIPFNVLK